MFTKSLDEFLKTSHSTKKNVVHFLRNNFKENIHFIAIKLPTKNGRPAIDYKLTHECYILLFNTYNKRNGQIIENAMIQPINILMSLERQTIGFITECFRGIIPFKCQYKIGKYRVDLCFTDLKLVVECDENNHDRRDKEYELQRETYIKENGFKIIRFDPNNEKFKISYVLNEINKNIISVENAKESHL
jgi:very-short-patch-repair endonuclease